MAKKKKNYTNTHRINGMDQCHIQFQFRRLWNSIWLSDPFCLLGCGNAALLTEIRKLNTFNSKNKKYVKETYFLHIITNITILMLLLWFGWVWFGFACVTIDAHCNILVVMITQCHLNIYTHTHTMCMLWVRIRSIIKSMIIWRCRSFEIFFILILVCVCFVFFSYFGAWLSVCWNATDDDNNDNSSVFSSCMANLQCAFRCDRCCHYCCGCFCRCACVCVCVPFSVVVHFHLDSFVFHFLCFCATSFRYCHWTCVVNALIAASSNGTNCLLASLFNKSHTHKSNIHFKLILMLLFSTLHRWCL